MLVKKQGWHTTNAAKLAEWLDMALHATKRTNTKLVGAADCGKMSQYRPNAMSAYGANRGANGANLQVYSSVTNPSIGPRSN